jgi:hypothetical protein
MLILLRYSGVACEKLSCFLQELSESEVTTSIGSSAAPCGFLFFNEAAELTSLIPGHSNTLRCSLNLTNVALLSEEDDLVQGGADERTNCSPIQSTG